MAQGVIDTNLGSALSAAQGFVKTVRDSIFSVMSAVEVGRFDKSFTQSGAQFSMGKSGTAGASISSTPDLTDAFAGIYPRNYNIGTMTPGANVIVKKRLFTTLAHENDVRFMDSYERAFLRASKNLFQLKAFQIATYESLTKFEQVLQQDHTLYIPAILSAIQTANAFGAVTDSEASTLESVLLNIAQRDLAGQDTNFTTWIIDQFDRDLANVGRGVGVIEFANFTKLDTSNKIDGGDGNATVEFEDPYHIMMISNDDIEAAVRGALFDNFTTTLLPALAVDQLRSLSDSLQNQLNSGNPVIQAQATAAINTVQQTATDVLRQQPISPQIVSFVRKKLRKFYLGKSVVQPTDGIHIFLKSDAIFENDDDPTGLPLGLDRFGVDEEILRQEMYVVTGDRNFDINLYKTLRDKNAFSGASVFAGVVENVTDNFNDGFYTLTITAKNNLWYLEQSFVNTEPALDQSQGFLHDPLTPFDLKFDNFGNMKTTSTEEGAGFRLSQDNIDRLSNIQIKHENGNLRGIVANVDNIVNSVMPGTNIQQVEHYPGMLYKWKEGIASVSVTTKTADLNGLFFNQSKDIANNAYGMSITSTAFDNMDAANVVSLLVTGQPYSITNFINDGIITGVANFPNTKNSSNGTSYFSAFFDVIQRQNKVLGNFKPLLNGESTNIDALKKLAYQKVSFRQLDVRIGQLEDLILTAQQKFDGLTNNVNSNETALLEKTRVGLQSEIDALRQEENLLIQQFSALDSEMQKISANQDSLGFSLDPDTREKEMKDFQFRQLYTASRRIEDVRYNRDINYFIVGTEYDSDPDIQAFQLNLRNGFKYFENVYDSAANKAREAAKVIDFELFADQSGNIRFRPPQYNKVPMSIYYELFRRKGQQGIDLIPDFIKALFIDNLSNAREGIVKANWEILIELGKSGDDTLINSLNAAVIPFNGKGVVEYLGYVEDPNANGNISIKDGNITNELIEFNSKDQVMIDRASPASTKTMKNSLTLSVLKAIGGQLEKRFGTSRMVINEEDIVNVNDDMAIIKRKSLFKKLRSLSSARNALVKAYLSQLNNLGVNAGNVGSSSEEISASVNGAIQQKQNQLAQEIFQVVSTGSEQGYARPTISSEFQNLVEDDSRNFIGRGSGRRFIIRDDSIISARIVEAAPDFCRINVDGQYPFRVGESILDGHMVRAGAVDYDLWRMYGFKKAPDVKVPFLTDPESQLKPYAVFLLLRQQSKVMRGSITVIGNEYYQLGDVVYLSDRDLLFYVTGINHSFGEGSDFTTSLTLEYGRPPGEYIPTPLDVIGKTLLKQGAASISVTKRQLNADTFYFPVRPLPVVHLANINSGDSGDVAMKKMLGTDDNQGRLINALMNVNFALQKPNASLVITGFTTGSPNDSGVQARIDLIKDWFMHPKIISTGLTDKNLVEYTGYAGIPVAKIDTKKLDVTKDKSTGPVTDNTNPDDVIASDQSIINTIGDPDLTLGILNACQEVHAFVTNADDMPDTIPFIIEIGIFYRKNK